VRLRGSKPLSQYWAGSDAKASSNLKRSVRGGDRNAAEGVVCGTAALGGDPSRGRLGYIVFDDASVAAPISIPAPDQIEDIDNRRAVQS
jgi:hypothetical protein